MHFLHLNKINKKYIIKYQNIIPLKIKNSIKIMEFVIYIYHIIES